MHWLGTGDHRFQTLVDVREYAKGGDAALTSITRLLNSRTCERSPPHRRLEGPQRPECVLATRAGDLFMADVRDGILQVDARGHRSLYLAQLIDGVRLKLNGFALRADGSFQIA